MNQIPYLSDNYLGGLNTAYNNFLYEFNGQIPSLYTFSNYTTESVIELLNRTSEQYEIIQRSVVEKVEQDYITYFRIKGHASIQFYVTYNVERYHKKGKLVTRDSGTSLTLLTTHSSLETLPQVVKDFIDEIKSCEKYKDIVENTMGIIASTHGRLYLEETSIKKVNIDFDLNYNEDFAPVKETIEAAIEEDRKSGIILLHGPMGTGKTTYIRYLISKSPRNVIYIPPNMTSQLSSPEFITFMLGQPNALLVIEDAEEVIKKRESGWGNQGVSNLLNISDGLLGDALGVLVIATFNCPVSDIDEALLRKGRLIAKYEFKSLEVPKAQKLSDSLGFKNQLTEKMTLAEIFNQEVDNFAKIKQKSKPVGFKLGA